MAEKGTLWAIPKSPPPTPGKGVCERRLFLGSLSKEPLPKGGGGVGKAPPAPDIYSPPLVKIILHMHTPARTRQCWSRQTQHGLGVCIWMHLVNGTGNSPSPGQPTPGVVKQDKSSRGSVDTSKTCSGPRRVRMSSGERPIGAAKGKQSDTDALCQTSPLCLRGGGVGTPFFLCYTPMALLCEEIDVYRLVLVYK